MLAVSMAIGHYVFGWIGAVMGIVATLAECLVTKIDDAITIPIFSGLAGHILMLIALQSLI
jgi:dolichol kinase